MTPPNEITIKSDGNVLTHYETIVAKGKSETQFIYRYTHSLTKQNEFLGLNERELNNLIARNKA